MSRSATIAWLLLASFVAQPWLAAAMAFSSCCCTQAASARAAGSQETEAEAHACCALAEASSDTAPQPDAQPGPLEIPGDLPRDCDCPQGCCVGVAKTPVAPADAANGVSDAEIASPALADASDLHDDPAFSRLKRPPRAASFA